MAERTVNSPLEADLTDVGYEYIPRHGQQLEPVDRAATAQVEKIHRMANDYQRAEYCRRVAELYHDTWYAGREHEIEYVKERFRAGDPRFQRMTDRALEATGRYRWSRSFQAKKLRDREERFSHWAELYLAFAEFQLPVKHRG